MQRTKYFGLVVLLTLSVGQTLTAQEYFAQGSIGYGWFRPARVAPGQIVSITIPETEPGLAGPLRAERVPLPTSLGGFSVELRQTAPPYSVAVPILGVHPASPQCPPVPGQSCGLGVRLDLQIPIELVPDYGDGPVGSPVPINQAVLVVKKRGIFYPAIPIAPQTDAVHILTTCDALTPGGNAACWPIVTHADGTFVSVGAPASPGETLVVYAYGLGTTNPAVSTGQPATGPGFRPISDIGLEFVFGPFRSPNALQFQEADSRPTAASYVGLVEGFVGLYQINFVVGEAPEELPTCGANSGANYVLTIHSWASRDSAALCVKRN